MDKMEETIPNYNYSVPESDLINLGNFSVDTTVVTGLVCKNKTYEPSYVYFRVSMDVFVVGCLAIFGIIGNCLSICVMEKDKITPRTTRIFIQALAVGDSIYLLTALVSQSLRGIWRYTDWFDPFHGSYPYIYRYVWAFSYISRLMSTLFIVLVTTDRYIAICHPLHHVRWCTTLRVRIAVVMATLFAICFSFPRFVDKIPIKWDNCTQTLKVKGFAEYLAINGHVYAIVYCTVFYYLFNFVIPLCILIVLNTMNIFALRSAYRRYTALTGAETAHRLKKRSKQENSTTLLLVVVVGVFIMCQTPAFVIQLIYTLYAQGVKMPDRNLMRYFYSVGTTLVTFNSAFNFIIYCLVSKVFRKVLWRYICKCRCVSKDQDFHSLGTTETSL